MAVKLSEIADRAGLSRQTVSNILNGKGHLFKPETRERVMLLSRAMGYRPNAVARALRSGRFNALGLVSSTVPNVSTVPELLNGIEAEMIQHNLHLVSGRFPNEELISADSMPKLLRELMVDGILLNYAIHLPPEIFHSMSSSDLPSVWLNILRDFDCVRPDDFQGGQIGTEYLLSLGHRRIAYLDLRQSEEQIVNIKENFYHYSISHRYGGYLAAMRAAGFPPRLICRPPQLSEEDAIPVLLEAIRGPERPTAILSYSFYGFGPLLLQLGTLGLKFPRDLSLLPFEHKGTHFGGLPMDCVVVPHYEVGRSAVKMLLQKIESPLVRLPQQVLACKTYQMGASVAPPPPGN